MDSKPQLGEIRSARGLGYKGTNRFIRAICISCGKERWVQLLRGLPKSARCKECQKAGGENASNWKGGLKRHSGGYIQIKVCPDDFFYPMANKDGYVFEHRLVVAKALNRRLLPWEIVHHRPGYTKDDNRYPLTLQLLPSQTKHMPSILIKRRLNELEKRVTLLEAENTALRLKLVIEKEMN